MTRDPTIGHADTLAGGTPAPPAAAAAEPRAGQLLARRYRLVSLLGRGGMGAVFLARDRELDDLVALKLLRAALAASPRALALLRSEVKLARRVTHRNVVRIFELGDHDGEPFLTMEYIEGQPLAALIGRCCALPVERPVAILRAVCAGVEAAHEAGVIHRDIKPDNVLVSAGGRIAVTDFGIARGAAEDADGCLVGTPVYMAPEQLRGGQATVRSDVYALGVLAYEVLTGRRPWGSSSTAELAALKTEPLAPELAESLPAPARPAILRALAPDPAQRPGSAAAFADELAGQLTAAAPAVTVPVELRPAGTPGVADRSRKRSLAVLPFANRGPAEDDVVIDGFTEDLVDALCSAAELRVLALSATRGLAGAEPHAAAGELGVDAVLTGTVERAAATATVRARAIAADGEQLWASRFALPPDRLLDATGRILAEVGPTLGADAGRRDLDTLPGEALELYLRARSIYRFVDRIDEAVKLSRLALRQVPDHPLVNATHATALMRMWMVVELDDGGLVEEATACARRALAAAPQMGEPHLALGLLHLHQGDPVAAMGGFRTALSRAPSLADAHATIGSLLVECGRVSEGLRRGQTALELDATSAWPRMEKVRTAALLGDWEAVERGLADPVLAPTSAPGWLLPMRVAAYRGDLEELRRCRALLQASSVPDSFGLRGFVITLADVHLGEERLPELPDLSRPADRARMSARRINFALQVRCEAAGASGDAAAILDMLEIADQHGLLDLLWLDRCPLLECARSHPRMAALRRRVEERAHTVYEAMWSA